ncbi:hypothetical protein NL676_001440 [Syzygium grande]|nr:hypothetical protein NL676_001440 [Syzygium grande]
MWQVELPFASLSGKNIQIQRLPLSPSLPRASDAAACMILHCSRAPPRIMKATGFHTSTTCRVFDQQAEGRSRSVSFALRCEEMAELLSRSSLCSSHHPQDTGECCGAPVFPKGFRAGRFAAGFRLRFRPVEMSRPLGLRSSVSRSRSGIFGDGGNLRIGKAQKWWEKGLQPNMREVSGAQDLVECLSSAGDKLVVVDFFSPGCGGCRALHPKICQLAETNPDAQFLQVNYEEHNSMCYSLNVHVLPFFRLYRGAHGRLCCFSCTNATVSFSGSLLSLLMVQ